MIRIGSDKGPARLFKRSTQHLIPIKVAQEDDTMKETENTINDKIIENLSSSKSHEVRTSEAFTRPYRHAVVDGKILR